MDYKLFGFGIVLIIIGLIVFIFAFRFAKWWADYVLENKLIFRTSKDQKLTKEEIKDQNFNKWPRRGLWLLWLSLIRILATMTALVGILTIIESIVDY